MKGLQKTAESMGIDSSTFDSVYKLNMLNKSYTQNLVNFEKNYEQLLDMGDAKRSEALRKNFNKYLRNILPDFERLENDVAGRLTGGSPLIMSQAREKITKEKFEQPFFDLKNVALEKLKREAQSVYPTRARKINPAEGSMGTGFYNVLDFIGQGFKNIALGGANPNLMNLSERQKENQLLKNMTGQELYRYNKDFRNFTYDDPITETDISDLEYNQPGVFYSKGGIAGLSGGDKSGPAPESGPASQGLRSLYNNGRKL